MSIIKTGSEARKQLSEIIDSLIIDNHPWATDDMHADLLSNAENRNNAIDGLITMIEFYREDL